MQPLYTALKINNEIELCEVSDPECKKLIERELLNHRISYYIQWQKSSFFDRKKSSCVICINENFKDQAETIIRGICDESGYNVKFIMKKYQNNYF